MTDDLEMTKLCAEAMGLVDLTEDSQRVYERIQHPHCEYDPLHDDAQAMALVKRFRLRLLPNTETSAWMADMSDDIEAVGPTLNRAIVECVAKMQAATAQPKPPSHYPPISAI